MKAHWVPLEWGWDALLNHVARARPHLGCLLFMSDLEFSVKTMKGGVASALRDVEKACWLAVARWPCCACVDWFHEKQKYRQDAKLAVLKMQRGAVFCGDSLEKASACSRGAHEGMAFTPGPPLPPAGPGHAGAQAPPHLARLGFAHAIRAVAGRRPPRWDARRHPAQDTRPRGLVPSLLQAPLGPQCPRCFWCKTRIFACSIIRSDSGTASLPITSMNIRSTGSSPWLRPRPRGAGASSS